MDKRDTQLMEVLAQNARVSHTVLSQALLLSKDAIAYRLERLAAQDYLSQFVLFIDGRVLGFTRYHLLLRIDASEKGEIAQALGKHPFVMWVNTFIGRFDMQIIVDARDSFHLNTIREELFALCQHKVKEYIVLTHLYDLEFTQLNPVLALGTKFERRSDSSFSAQLTTKKFPVSANFTRYRPTIGELDVLFCLAADPRASLVQIAAQIGSDRQTVKKRISNLIRQKVILNFGAIPNLSKLGFVTYYLLVRVAQDAPLAALKKPFHELQNIFYAGKMIGDYDLLLYLNARNPQELQSSIERLKGDIGQYIVHYDLLVQEKVHSWCQYTKGIHNSLRKV